MKGTVAAVMIQIRCYKYHLPDGRILDVLAEVVHEISLWLQNAADMPEAGGYIVGHQHSRTRNVTLDLVTTPQPKDIRTRIRCEILDEAHFGFLERVKHRRSYYMGAWHTHPQKYPIPSSTDWKDWNATIEANKTNCGYIFFLIAGTKSFEIWAGEIKSKKITKLDECYIEQGFYSTKTAQEK